MSIITLTISQLSQTQQYLKKDIADKLVTYNYLFCEDDCNYLDVDAIKEYISITDIKQFLLLKELNKRCSDIIKIWNEDFKGLPNRMFEEPFSFADADAGKSLYCSLEFNAAYLTSHKWNNYNTIKSKYIFVANYQYAIYPLPKIAQRCAEILNFVTASYPETKDFETIFHSHTLQETESYTYTVTAFTDGTAYHDKLYTDPKRIIEQSGSDYLRNNGAKIKLYTPKLAYLFSNPTLEVYNLRLQKSEIVKTDIFFKAYYEGYKEGQNFFNERFNVSPEILYGAGSKKYAKDIGHNYSFADVNQNSAIKGWQYVKHYNNEVLSIQDVKQQGYYSGIVDKVEVLVIQYPHLFADTDLDNSSNPLKAIWLPEAKISIEDFYKKGIKAGIWDENHNITCERGSIYGTGKALLGSLSVALKGYAVNSNIDYKIVGKAFCEAFKIELKEKTQNPYKLFSSTNPEYIKELKRVFVAK